MAQSLEDRMKNNTPIATGTSALPTFEGLMTAHNGNTGTFSLMVPGSDFKDARPVNSITFFVDFVMTRLKLREGADTVATSNYVTSGETTPYVVIYNGNRYQGKTKKEVLSAMGGTASLSQETIYVGYLVKIDGQNVDAQAVWHVSRGNNAWYMSQAIEAAGGLTARTLITASANGATHTNQSGGVNQILSFHVAQFDESKIQGFLQWANQGGLVERIAQYRDDMIEASENIVNTVPVPQAQQAPQQTWGQPQQQGYGALQQGYGQPQGNPFAQAANDPLPGNMTGGPNGQYGSQNQQVPQVQQGGFASDQLFGNANVDPFAAAGQQAAPISDDDLPF